MHPIPLFPPLSKGLRDFAYSNKVGVFRAVGFPALYTFLFHARYEDEDGDDDINVVSCHVMCVGNGGFLGLLVALKCEKI